MEAMEFTKMRLEWLEEQVNHFSAQLNQIQADIHQSYDLAELNQLEGLKLQCINYLDGFKAELEELSKLQFATV